MSEMEKGIAQSSQAAVSKDTLDNLYGFERFDSNFTSDVAIFLKKNDHEDSFVRTIRTPRKQVRKKF